MIQKTMIGGNLDLIKWIKEPGINNLQIEWKAKDFSEEDLKNLMKAENNLITKSIELSLLRTKEAKERDCKEVAEEFRKISKIDSNESYLMEI
jgi:hypothetical protein